MTDPALLGLAAHLDNEPAETLGILADRLEDLGQDDLARAYRYLAKEKLAPLRHADRWHWRLKWDQRYGESPVLDVDCLPLGHQLTAYATWALTQLPGRSGLACNEARSRSEAFLLAARALVLGWELERRDRERRDRERQEAEETAQREREESVQDATDPAVLEDLPF